MNKLSDVINQLSAEEIIRGLNLETARDGGIVCPKLSCRNGAGEDGTGIKPYKKNGKNKWKCHKCGEHFGNNFGLIKYVLNLSRDAEVFQQAKEIFHLTDHDEFISIPTKTTQNINPPVAQKTENKKVDDFLPQLIENARNNLKKFVESRGGSYRGLFFETLQKFNCGYLENWESNWQDQNGQWHKEFTPRLIIPTSPYHCLARLTVNKEELKISDESKEHIIEKQHKGEKSIFGKNLVNDAEYIFVTEGEFDAMSITQCGFSAVAIGGSIISEGLKVEWQQFPASKKFIILLDNDKAGKENAEKDVEILKSLGFFATKDFLDNFNDCKDANEFLQADSEKLKQNLKEILKRAKAEYFQKPTGIVNFSDVFDTLDAIIEPQKENLLKWGFKTLDDKLPLLPGCYLLGALPALGKTTFAMNVAANLCDEGVPVLYVSYEPTKEQLAFKDLARYWFSKYWGKNSHSLDEFVPTATAMMLGQFNERHKDCLNTESMKEIRQELKEKRKNFYFLQGKRENSSQLIEKIKPYVENGGRFIVIDYIQLVRDFDDKKSVREQIDAAIRDLQIFQSTHKLTILFISSFNRENYRNYVCLESFKESGGLEYTADAILALQFEYKEKEKRDSGEEFQKKKQEIPRHMELVCLKNRFGTDFVAKFTYHSAHETFMNIDEEEKKKKIL